jgi:hypothetical protein
VPESGELALDAAVSPARVLPGQPDDELTELAVDAGAAGRGWVGPFLGDQAAVPGQQGGGGRVGGGVVRGAGAWPGRTGVPGRARRGGLGRVAGVAPLPRVEASASRRSARFVDSRAALARTASGSRSGRAGVRPSLDHSRACWRVNLQVGGAASSLARYRRCSTVSWWRRTRISISLVVSDQVRSTIQLNSVTNIR